MAAKDFGLIENDYAFFMAHATEAENDIAQYVRELDGFPRGGDEIRWLDFGCGAGDFTERLLSTLNWPSEFLRLSLVEPVASQREAAAKRLRPFSRQPVESLKHLPCEEELQFDLILSNHALYYVEDLNATLRQLVSLLKPGGKLLLAMAGWDNVLIQFWKTGFTLLDRPVPYFVSEDADAALSRQGIIFRKAQASYQLRFPDTEENRRKILHFLFGEYLQKLSLPRMLSEFEPFSHGGRIEMNTHSDHFMIEGNVTG